jgi:hypothetical protein
VVEGALTSVAVGALGNIIADAASASAGSAHRRLKRDPEERVLRVVVAEAASAAFFQARPSWGSHGVRQRRRTPGSLSRDRITASRGVLTAQCRGWWSAQAAHQLEMV